MRIPLWCKVVYSVFIPLFAIVWIILNPKRLWREIKFHWNTPSPCNHDCNEGRNCTCCEKK